MFYVSSVPNEHYKIGVTDTEDGVEDFFSNKELAKIVHEDKINVYGASYYNYEVECTVLTPNITISSSKLKELLDAWRKLHNPWTGHPVEDYLACAKIGTKIVVDYSYVGDGDRRLHNSQSIITKLADEKWKFEDNDNMADGEIGDSKFAAWALEVSCIYSRPKRIGVN